MKKAFLLAVVSILLPMAAYAAPDRVGAWDAGVNIAGNFTTSDRAEDAYYLGGDFSYGVQNWLGVGVSVGWADSRYKIDSGGSLANGGRYGMIPVFVDLIFRVPANADSPLVPYGVVGLGGVWTSTHGSGVVADRGYNASSKDSFALKLGAGVDYFIGQNWAYNLEGGYVLTDANVEVTDGAGNFVSKADMDYWYIGGGVKWIFS